MGAEQLFDRAYRGRNPLDQRIAIPRIADRRCEDVTQTHGAIIAQHQHIGIERSRNTGSQQAGARDQIQSQSLVMLDGGTSGCGTLTADHL